MEERKDISPIDWTAANYQSKTEAHLWLNLHDRLSVFVTFQLNVFEDSDLQSIMKKHSILKSYGTDWKSR